MVTHYDTTALLLRHSLLETVYLSFLNCARVSLEMIVGFGTNIRFARSIESVGI